MKHTFPKETWAFPQQQPGVLFIGVRMEITTQYGGRPPGAVNRAPGALVACPGLSFK